MSSFIGCQLWLSSVGIRMNVQRVAFIRLCYTGTMANAETAKMLRQAWDRVRLHADWEEPDREAYIDPSGTPEPYPSVYCLPHVRENLVSALSVVPLSLFFAKTRASLSQLSPLLLECIENMDAIDRFYEIFQEEQWIVHELLHISKIKPILAEAESAEISVREASDKIADIYDEDMIEFGITRLKSINSMSPDKERGPFCERTFLLWDARDLYLSENYRGSIHLLLACVDGAVNDFYETGEDKQGLWMRSPATMVPYDTYAGHKHGLVEVLKTAKQGVSELPVRTEKERYDAMRSGQISGNMFGGMFPERHLRRNGIEHGMLINYSNKIVAAKAWNLVFAMGDWMNSIHKAKIPLEPPKSFSKSMKDIMISIKSNEQYKELLESHVKQQLTPDHEDFSEHPLKKRTEHFLVCWKGKGSGVQCQKMWQFGTERTLPPWWNRGDDRCIRDHFEMHKIRGFQIDMIDHYSYQFADVRITCHYDGYIRGKKIDKDIKMILKWTWTDEDDNLPFESDNPEWYLMTWYPWLNVETVNEKPMFNHINISSV